MSPASTRRRETNAGKASPLSEKNGIGSSSPGPVRRAEPVGCVPERLHLFPREEGCRGRHGEAARLLLLRHAIKSSNALEGFTTYLAAGLHLHFAMLVRLQVHEANVVILTP